MHVLNYPQLSVASLLCGRILSVCPSPVPGHHWHCLRNSRLLGALLFRPRKASVPYLTSVGTLHPALMAVRLGLVQLCGFFFALFVCRLWGVWHGDLKTVWIYHSPAFPLFCGLCSLLTGTYIFSFSISCISQVFV